MLLQLDGFHWWLTDRVWGVIVAHLAYPVWGSSGVTCRFGWSSLSGVYWKACVWASLGLRLSVACVWASLGLRLCVACVLTSLGLRVACVLALLGYRPGRGPTPGVWQRHWYRFVMVLRLAWRVDFVGRSLWGFFKRLQATCAFLQAPHQIDRRVCDRLAYTSLEPSTLHFYALLCTSLHFQTFSTLENFGACLLAQDTLGGFHNYRKIHTIYRALLRRIIG